MNTVGFDMWDEFPKDMLKYLRNYGFHFNKKACDYAVSFMTKKMEPIDVITKANLETMLKKYNITLDNDVMYDSVYVVNMGKADFMGSSILTEENLCKFVKDYIDDEDQAEGFVFCRWYCDMMHNGHPIEWEDLL